MKRSRFSEEQIIGILKEHQAGLGAKELCRKHGISDATFYKWRSKYGGTDVSDARRLKTLESENAKLKSWRDQKRPQWGVFPEQRNTKEPRREGRQRHPPRHAQTIFGGREDQNCAGWPEARGQHCGAVPS